MAAGGDSQSAYNALPAIAQALLPDPFRQSTAPRSLRPGEPRPRPAQKARLLLEFYRNMLDIIWQVQEQLEADQEFLVRVLADAQVSISGDEELGAQVFLFREGLDLRTQDFKEAVQPLLQDPSFPGEASFRSESASSGSSSCAKPSCPTAALNLR
ncbi:unnamed protein product [Polarella glacialis]|uniref:Uncharacterized protein n=1 Tax=Polarella glacialis TaxID=89957 RepID=A0A813KHA4_POLGL|nr:unnamed protein product [Polarella glacialis]